MIRKKVDCCICGGWFSVCLFLVFYTGVVLSSRSLWSYVLYM